MDMTLSEPQEFYLDVDCRYPDMKYHGKYTDGLVVYGRTFGDQLDGHERPVFTKVQADLVVEAVIRSMNNNADTDQRPYYDHVRDAYVFSGSFCGEVYPGFQHDGETYYPLHGSWWEWEDASPLGDRPLPKDKVLFVGNDICPFCGKKSTVHWEMPDAASTTEIGWQAHCESEECDVHFVVGFTPNHIQAYTDEHLGTERGHVYLACPRIEVGS